MIQQNEIYIKKCKSSNNLNEKSMRQQINNI